MTGECVYCGARVKPPQVACPLHRALLDADPSYHYTSRLPDAAAVAIREAETDSGSGPA